MRNRLVVSSLFAVSMAISHLHPATAQAAETPVQVLFRNVRIFDGTSADLSERANVLVENNLIKSISANDIAVNDGVTIVHGGGRVMTPGFIDSHTHMSLIAPFDQLENEYTAIYVGAAAGQMAEDMLMRGFTSVRDAGGASIGIQRAIDEGWIRGPRVFSSGAFITQTSGHLDMRDRTNPHHNVGGSHSWRPWCRSPE